MQVLSSFVSTKLTALNWNISVPPCAISPVSDPLQTEDGLFSPPMLVPCKDLFSSALKTALKPFPALGNQSVNRALPCFHQSQYLWEKVLVSGFSLVVPQDSFPACVSASSLGKEQWYLIDSSSNNLLYPVKSK